MMIDVVQTTIKTLFEKGHNKTQIAKLLGIDRKTVRKVLKNPDKDFKIEKSLIHQCSIPGTFCICLICLTITVSSFVSFAASVLWQATL